MADRNYLNYLLNFALLNFGVMGKNGAAYFKLDVQGLSNSSHLFTFSVDSNFFEMFENSTLRKGELECKLELVKNERLMEAHFSITGKVELECDRSLDLFDYPIDFKRDIIFKYGESFEELDEKVIQVPFGIDQLDLAPLIYEFVALEIPMRKIHPRFKEEETKEEEGFIFSTERKEEAETDKNIDTTDPRWSVLKNLKK